jgi:translation initiation factor IF-1
MARVDVLDPDDDPRGDADWLAPGSSEDDQIVLPGTVVAVHGGGSCRVRCDSGRDVTAQPLDGVRMFPGDRVSVGVSPYDPVRVSFITVGTR